MLRGGWFRARAKRSQLNSIAVQWPFFRVSSTFFSRKMLVVYYIVCPNRVTTKTAILNCKLCTFRPPDHLPGALPGLLATVQSAAEAAPFPLLLSVGSNYSRRRVNRQRRGRGKRGPTAARAKVAFAGPAR